MLGRNKRCAFGRVEHRCFHAVLKGQQIEREFLYRFLEEWKYNQAFKTQFRELLNNPARKEQMVLALNEVTKAIKGNETPNSLFDFLNNI